MAIQSLNPATGEVVKTFDEWTPKQTRAALDGVAEAWTGWKALSFAERAGHLRAVAEVMRERSGELARLAAIEMGKPVKAGAAEAVKSATVCDFYAEHAEAMLQPEPVPECGRGAFVRYEPLGTVLAVMPWNFPFWQVLRIAAPTLMAGNVMVLKHASNVPQCALAIEECFKAAGLPENVFRTLLIGARQVEAVLDHPSVFGVSLTGSDGAGRKVASAAGARLKKCVMELGGSDPFVVLPDADLPQAARVGAASRCLNAGQTCIAAKRFIVEDEVVEPFVQALRYEMTQFKVGDPLDPNTDIGPMASESLRADLQKQVDRCLAAGGELVCGGSIPEGPGCFYPLTIIRDVPLEDPICREELFGPVALVFRAADVEEAVAMANDTPFGLGGSVWTRDEKKGLELAGRISAGSVFVNGQVRSDPLLPFGGIRCSGFGRELGSYGIREFVNIKSVCIG